MYVFPGDQRSQLVVGALQDILFGDLGEGAAYAS